MFPIGILCTSLHINITFTVTHICEHRSAGKHFLQISGTHCLLFVFTFLGCTKPIFLLGILALGNLGQHISQVQQKRKKEEEKKKKRHTYEHFLSM